MALRVLLPFSLFAIVACSAPLRADSEGRGPASETARGGNAADVPARSGHPDGIGEWLRMDDMAYQASRKAGERYSPREKQSRNNPFGRPYGGASETSKRSPRGGKRCPNLTSQINAVLGPERSHLTACYESLFNVESTCNPNVYHDPKKAHNHFEGIGLCAIEKSPYIRLVKQQRGPDCAEVSSTLGQIRCCVHLMQSTNGRYFGTIPKLTPRCE